MDQNITKVAITGETSCLPKSFVTIGCCVLLDAWLVTDSWTLVTGSPGIGKSYFLFYLMRCLAQIKPLPVVVLDIRNNQTLCFTGDKVMSGTRADFASYLVDPNTWYLVGDTEFDHTEFPPWRP